jgi:nucleoside-diphosphate kinase
MSKVKGNKNMERTLVLLKPDAVDRGLIGEIITRFERAGLKIAAIKMVHAKKEMAEKHYTEDLAVRRGQHVRDLMVEMITSGPIVAIVLEGVDAVENVRKMIGTTEPKSAAPGTIRGDYSHVSFKHADAKKMGVYNLIHASGSVEEAPVEIAVWFTPEELYEHRPGYTKHTIAY